jgi:hypothetical protein
LRQNRRIDQQMGKKEGLFFFYSDFYFLSMQGFGGSSLLAAQVYNNHDRTRKHINNKSVSTVMWLSDVRLLRQEIKKVAHDENKKKKGGCLSENVQEQEGSIDDAARLALSSRSIVFTSLSFFDKMQYLLFSG